MIWCSFVVQNEVNRWHEIMYAIFFELDNLELGILKQDENKESNDNNDIKKNKKNDSAKKNKKEGKGTTTSER